MSRPMPKALAALDPRGRLSAPAFRHVLIRCLLAFFGFLCLSVWLGSFGLRLPAILAFGGTLLTLLATIAQTIRRLHDRNRTGWWLGLYLLGEAARFLPLDTAIDTDPLPTIALVLAMLGYLVWFWIETGLRPGTRGVNRYGPAPADGAV